MSIVLEIGQFKSMMVFIRLFLPFYTLSRCAQARHIGDGRIEITTDPLVYSSNFGLSASSHDTHHRQYNPNLTRYRSNADFNIEDEDMFCRSPILLSQGNNKLTGLQAFLFERNVTIGEPSAVKQNGCVICNEPSEYMTNCNHQYCSVCVKRIAPHCSYCRQVFSSIRSLIHDQK